jgi:type II secretory pathway pseudopilin PulG
MKCPSKNRAFTLVESMAAIALLAFICASVWLVLERCTASAADSVQRMRAFEIARDNMEKMLGSDSVEEKTEYGTSEEYPDIRWQTTTESFYEPMTSSMWARGVCSAEYTDSAGTTQNVELTTWLTKLSAAQIKQLGDKAELQKKILAKYILATEELAAEFAGVDIKTIQQWVKNGMPMTIDSEYLKPWLDLYLQTNGKPTDQDKQDLLTKYPELSSARPSKSTADKSASPALQTPGETETKTQPDSENAPSEEIDPELQKEIDKMMKETP